jgi:hypothetical protein
VEGVTNPVMMEITGKRGADHSDKGGKDQEQDQKRFHKSFQILVDFGVVGIGLLYLK